MDSKLTHNPISEKLTFRKETIEHKIDLYDARKNYARNLQFFIGLFVTLVIALTSTPLENIITKPTLTQWFISLSLAAVTAIVIWKLYLFFSTENPISDLKVSLYETYINKPDINSLFIIKRVKDNKNQILVQRHTAWGCYFLPYKGIREKVEDIRTYSQEKIENILGLPEGSTIVSMLLEQHDKTEKYHPHEKVVKEYHSFYFHLSMKNPVDNNHHLHNDEFSFGGNEFIWKSLHELEEDETTIIKNGDVLKLLRENNNFFIESSKTFQDA